MKRSFIIGIVLVVILLVSCGRPEKVRVVQNILSREMAVRSVDTLFQVGDTVRLTAGLDGDGPGRIEVVATIVR